MTTVTAGPLNDLPSRTPSAMPTPTRNRRSISAMTKHYPPQAERVPLSASASRYQRRNMATGSKNRRTCQDLWMSITTDGVVLCAPRRAFASRTCAPGKVLMPRAGEFSP